MTIIHLLLGGILVVMIGSVYGTYRIGYAYPRISLLLSGLALCAATFFGYLLATDKGDGPVSAGGYAILSCITYFTVIISITFLAGSLFKLAAMTRSNPK